MQTTTPNPRPTASFTGDLSKIFNTALVATRANTARDISAELFAAMSSPAHAAVLEAIKNYARTQSVSETQAASDVISVFRKIDSLWSDYLFQQGIESVKS